ncbi:MAG: hypothetical protein AAGA08_01575 [Pseudomonadota bacterium]
MTRLILSLALLLGAPAMAQDTDISGKIAVELNSAETREGSCMLTFMITNGTEAAASQVVYETVLFDTSGQVDRLTLFDFGALPPARPRVRQFMVPELACESLGRVLFNGANTCAGDGLDPGVCDKGLLPGSRLKIEVLG